MNAEQIIAKAVEEELTRHVLIPWAKKCACERWSLPGKERLLGTLEIQFKQHVAKSIAARLTERATWKAA